MLKKIGLLSLIMHLSLLAMQPLTDLSRQFRDAYAANNFDQAQQAINQIKPIRADQAEQFQKLLNEKRDLMQKRQAPAQATPDAAQQKIIAEKDTQIAQLQKELALAKQNVVSSQANAELRTRLADAEKALQAQTKKADDCEQQKNAAQKTEESLRKQIDEMKKNQGTAAEQAQKSQIIQKRQDELYAANQKYEKQVRELTTQLEAAQKEVKALEVEDGQKADRILILETDAEAEKKMKEKAQNELASVQKEIREIAKDLKEQKELYASLSSSMAKRDFDKEKKELQAKYAADLEAFKKEQAAASKEETLKIFKDAQEKVAKFKEGREAANQSAISFANTLLRQKEIKPKDVQDLIDILKAK